MFPVTRWAQDKVSAAAEPAGIELNEEIQSAKTASCFVQAEDSAHTFSVIARTIMLIRWLRI